MVKTRLYMQFVKEYVRTQVTWVYSYDGREKQNKGKGVAFFILRWSCL